MLHYVTQNQFINVRAEFGTLFLKQSVGYTEIRHKSLVTLKTHRH